MATPWMLTTIALVLLVPSSVAVTAPYDNDWWPSGSLIRIPIGLGISSAKKAYAVQALEETGAAYDASSVRSFLKSTTISPEQAQRDLDYTNYALNATARFATSWLLLSVVGMFFFAMGLALRHGWSIYGYSIHDKLLYAAPVTFLGGLFFLALAWPLWWFHIEIGGYLAPLPLPVCTFASLALAFTSSWISGRTNLLGGVLRMYVVTGLVFFALSVFLLGRIYLSGVESFGMWLFAFGLAFIAGFMVWHIRGGRRKEDVDERFDTLLRRH